MVKIINTTREWENAVAVHQKSKRLMVVCFGASWCGPCKKLTPLFIDLSEKKEYENIDFYKVDVDDIDESITNQFHIDSVPTTIILENSVVIKKITGNDIDTINKKLEKFVNL